jgi:predicted porin
MKFTKLSLVAALAVSSAFAGGDIAPVEPAAAPVVEATSPWSFSGDAKLYYSSTDSDTVDLFSKDSAAGQAAISADIGYAINSNWKVNMGLTGLATLGLDDSVVSGVWLFAGANATDGALPLTSVGDALWIDTLNVTGTAFDGKATFVIGRQELDTPLAFSEQWSIAANTFDAAVALVKPVENVTLVAGYIYDGNGNGERIGTFEDPEGGFTHDNGYFPVAGIEEGAWTVAAVATISDVTAQAWYYDVIDVAQAVWLQADTNIAGFTLGAQYAWITGDDTLTGIVGDFDDSSAFAVKAGYKMDKLNVWAAYSSVDEDGHIPVGNTATMMGKIGWGGHMKGGQSKLYTEAWWNYGVVGQPGAESIAVAANYAIGDVSLMAQYTNVADAANWGNQADVFEMDELTLVAGTKVADLDVQVAYIYGDYTNKDTITNTQIDSHDDNTVQLYVTYSF